MNVNFYLKDGKKADSLVFMVFYLGGVKYKLSTGVKVRTRDWTAHRQRLKASAKKRKVNLYLADLKDRAEDLLFELSASGKSFDKDKFKSALFQGANTSSLVAFFSSLAEDRKRSGQFSHSTMKVYRTALNKLTAYAPGCSFEDITLEWGEGFISWLFDQGFSTNYVNKILGTLKAVLNVAYDRGLTKNQAFRSRLFAVPKVEAHSIFLDEGELDRVDRLQIGDSGVDNARKMFLLMAWTGLRYSDLAQANMDHVVFIQGKAHLKLNQVKTKGQVVIPLKEKALAIIQEGFQVISNQKANKHLKKVGRLAGLDQVVVHTVQKGSSMEKARMKKWELLTCHTGRRSFATNSFLAGVPVLSIMKITGHKTEKAFLKYVKIDQVQNAVHVMNHPFFN